MPEVKVVGVSKSFGSIQALEDVDLTVEDRSYTCLLGPSGCGKTTLLRIIAGLIEPDEGEVYIDGKPVRGVPPERRGLGFAFQSIALFPHMTLIENVCFGPQVRGLGYREALSIGRRYLERIAGGVEGSSYPSEVSGGLAQLISVARSLATGARLLLLDEPLGALDPEVKAVLKFRLRQIVKDMGLTAIHVTHDQEEALSIADKVVVMRRGRILQADSPRKLYWRPRSLFVAYFVGEANVSEAVVEEASDEGVSVDIDGLTLTSRWVPTPVREGERAVLAVRPESFRVTDRVEANSFEAEVVSARYLGGTLRVEVSVNGRISFKARLPGFLRGKVKPGSRVKLSIPEDRCFVYPYPERGLDEEASPV